MQLTLDDNQASYQIRAFQPGRIQVNNTIYANSIIISASRLIDNWAPQTIDELTASNFQEILGLKPTILLLGTGTILNFPNIELYGHLLNQGIGVEIMNTSAACHTYNALTAEGRDVIAALIIR